MISIRRTIAAVILGAATVTGSVACDSHTKPSAADVQQSATTWALGNYAAVQQAETDASNGDIDAAVNDWNNISVPPVDPADWNTATSELNNVALFLNKGDTADAQVYASKFESSANSWASAFDAATGQTGAE